MRHPGVASAVLPAAAASASRTGRPRRCCLRGLRPDQTGEARVARLQGTVLLRVVVGTDGRARPRCSARARTGTRRAGHRLRLPAALRSRGARRQAGSRRASRGGPLPPAGIAGLAPGAGRVRATRGIVTPRNRAAPYPPDARAGTRGGGVAVRFEVNEQGLPRNKAIVHRWRFRPAWLDGLPVPAAAEVTLALGDWQLPPEPAPPFPRVALGERVSFRP